MHLVAFSLLRASGADAVGRNVWSTSASILFLTEP